MQIQNDRQKNCACLRGSPPVRLISFLLTATAEVGNLAAESADRVAPRHVTLGISKLTTDVEVLLDAGNIKFQRSHQLFIRAAAVSLEVALESFSAVGAELRPMRALSHRSCRGLEGYGSVTLIE